MTINIGHNGAALSAKASNAKINGAITRVRTSLGKYRETVREAAFLIVTHAREFGDCDKARILARAIAPKDRPLLVAYFKEVSPIRVTLGKLEKDDSVRLMKPDKATYTPFDMNKAAALLWWDMPKEPGTEKELPGVLDFFDRLEKYVTKPANKADAWLEADREELAEIAQDIKALVNKYRAERLAKKVNAFAPSLKAAS